MDELDLLRDLGRVPEPGEMAVRRSRRSLVERIAEEQADAGTLRLAAEVPTTPLTTPGTPTRRLRLGLAGLVGVAAAAIVVMTVLSVVRPTGTPFSPPPASAAELTLASSSEEMEARLATGDYLHVRVVTHRWAAVMLRRNRQEVAVGRDGLPVAWRNRTVAETWTPANGEGERVRRFVSRDFAPVSTEALRYFENAPATWTREPAVPSTSVADLPSDPAEAARWLVDNAPGELVGDAAAWEYGVSLLIDPTLPPAARPDVLAALGQLGSASLTPGGTLLKGRRVDVVGLAGSSEQLMVAPDTDRWLGVVSTWTPPGLETPQRSVTRFHLGRSATLPAQPGLDR